MVKKKSKTKSQTRRDQINARKSKRYAKAGREMEQRVETILQNLVVAGTLERATLHKAFSQADREHRDFTVGKTVAGEYVECSFGITISARSWSSDKVHSGDIPQFHFPLEIKDETIIDKVINLFPADVVT